MNQSKQNWVIFLWVMIFQLMSLQSVACTRVLFVGADQTVITGRSMDWEEDMQSIGGNVFLPGTSRAADRFARASYYNQTIPKEIAPQFIKSIPNESFSTQAIAEVSSVMRSVSVPLGISTPNAPNIASTLWRSLSDQKNLVYFFDSATRPNTFWISFSHLNFAKGASVQRLPLKNGEVYGGEVSKNFVPSASFSFLTAD